MQTELYVRKECVCSAKKLEKKLQQEKKQADHLMAKIMSADKPKFGKAAKAAARSPHGTVAAEPSTEASEASAGHRSPSLIPNKNGAGTPNKLSGTRYVPPDSGGCSSSGQDVVAGASVWFR